ALQRFGDRQRVMDETREARGTHSLEASMQDLRWALRSLRRSPGFTMVAAIVLALAVGATTAVFSVVNAVLIRPLPYREPSRLLSMSSVVEAPGAAPHDAQRVMLSDVVLWRGASRTIDSMGGFAYTQLPIRIDDQAFSPVTALVDPEFLPTLGVAPARGSQFAPQGTSGADYSIIISHGLWVRAFNTDPGVVGRAVSVNGVPYTVRGVMPEGFQFPRADASYYTEPVDLIVPASSFSGFPQDTYQWFGIARLRDGVSLASAQQEMRIIARGLATTDARHKDWTVSLASLAEVTTRNSRPALMIVFAITLVLLVIASSNVMNLLFSRGAARSGELAIRQAMGCSTGRLVRQLILESLCLTVVSGAIGVLLAALATNALVALSPVHLPITQHINLDGAVLVFALGVCFVTALVSGLVPAIHAARTSDALVRAPGTRATGNRTIGRLQRSLCVVQIALGVALLSVAGALTGGLWRLSTTSPGYRSDDVLGFSFSVPGDHSMQQRVAFYKTALEQVRTIPGVTSAGFITFLPPETRAGVFMGFTIEGAPPDPNRTDMANHLISSPGYIATMGMQMASGRDFAETDDEHANPVVIVNEAFVKRYLPDGNPLGRRVGIAFTGGKPTREIIGVLRDIHDRGLGRAAFPTIYIPFRQFALGYGSIAVRTSIDPASIAPEIRRRLGRIDPAIPLVHFERVTDRIRASLDEPRFYTWLAVGCAMMAVLFVTLGLYGIVSFNVSRRTSEFGVRMAIGASGGAILRLVLAQGAWMSGVGAVVGIALALASARVLRTLPFPVQELSTAALGGAVGLVICVTLLASYVPARRASRVSPLTALRRE
ncbi:MAG TPA: ABC transporter permease, partial [Gemmatimonadaceae bacterium]|nr:ABC transporter permease [Gemmatimonadaceae bacterium]